MWLASLPVAFGAEAQKELSEVASVPFGTSREKTLDILSTRFGMSMPRSLQKPSELYFTGGEFAGIAVGGWWFRYAAGQLYEVSITFETKDPLRTLDKVAALLSEKYGTPTEASRSYSFPYNIPFKSLDDAKIKEAFKPKGGLSLSMEVNERLDRAFLSASCWGLR